MTDRSASLPSSNTSNDQAPAELNPIYVVALGASAGGLDALEKVFQNLPEDSGAAFVVIQHLSPDHKSIMDSLLARHTHMPVKTVTHNMKIEANAVYLIPPGSLMQIEGNHFLLTPKFPRALSLPIDVFFHSLAANYKEKAVGVVLSGTGSDGTRGAGSINEAGGLLIAQEPESAKFDGMPRSLISTGLVDLVLPIEEIPKRIYHHVTSQGNLNKPIHDLLKPYQPEENNDTYSEILSLLAQSGGINFNDYKPGTVTRRIERRMAVRQINTLFEYHGILKSDSEELSTLRRELLIPVTCFFRDTEAFDALKREVIDKILSRSASDKTIRIWCAGTSTGEEAYSIGMLMLEAFQQAKQWRSLKIFATDVEQANIDTASAGIYPESIVAEIPPEHLEKFFSKRGNQFVVKNELRQCIVFAKHNLLTDPPFTKMDLVVCRNVLIYFKAEAQQRVLRRLQFSLRPNSYLFLGSSETLGALQVDFENISQRHKIWKVLKSSPLPLDIDSRINSLYSSNTSSKKTPLIARTSNSDAIHRGYETLIEAFSPPVAILVNSQQELLHSYGNVNKYLQFRPGQASLDLNRILPEALIPVASALLFKCSREGTSTISDVIRVQLPPYSQDSIKIPLRLSAWPVASKNSEGKENSMYLLVFEEISDTSANNTTLAVDIELETSERMEILQHELAATRESLQATIEELETSNEELQATNEEMMASNEELQSSNEELQSVNEELNTVNAEYQEKIDILNRVNADLDNLAKVIASGTIFVDEKLNITRFSPDATEIFKLRLSDIGRPLSDISHTLYYPEIINDLSVCIKSGEMLERNVVSKNNKNYLVKMLPYQVPSSSSRGLVVNFIDVTSIQQATTLQKLLDSSFASMAVISELGEIVLANTSWHHGVSIFPPECNPVSAPLHSNYISHLKNLNSNWSLVTLKEIKEILSGFKESAKITIDEENIVIFSAKKLQNPNNGILLEFVHGNKK